MTEPTMTSSLPAFDGTDLAQEMVRRALNKDSFLRNETWLTELLISAIMTGHGIGYAQANLDQIRTMLQRNRNGNE